MGDEEIIKQRLLIDGDGTGDDRRLNMLLKNFIKWCNANDPQDQMFFDRLMAQWAQCTFAAHKSKFALEMIDEEIKNYERLSSDIDKNIEEAQEELETCKLDLLVAKKIRKNREEYDSMAKVIMSQPDRKKTSNELEKLRAEMSEIEQESAGLDNKIKKRQKSFKVLMTAVQQLEQLGRDTSDEEAEDDEEEQEEGEGNSMEVDEVFVVEDADESPLELQPISPAT